MKDLRPELRLRVGVTGHRPARIAAGVEPVLCEQIQGLLSQIVDKLRQIDAGHTGLFADTGPKLTLVAPLAAGADSLAADAALAVGCTLEACLPFALERYRKDFSVEELVVFDRLLAHADRVFSLPSEVRSDDESYAAIGSITLEQSDILLAVWDGNMVRGRGGTADVMMAAIAAHVPVIMLDANGKNSPQMIWSGLEDEPHDVPSLDTLTARTIDAALDHTVSLLVLPPEAERDAIADFVSGEGLSLRRSFAYPALLALTGAQRWRAAFASPDRAGAEEQLRPMLGAYAPGQQCRAHVERILAARYAHADIAANLFAQRHRSGFTANFALAALAVFLALASLLAPGLKVAFIIGELLVITAIIYRTRRAASRGWHRRWIDSRSLAEQLRLLALSSALGNLVLRTPTENVRESNWPNWYARATAREMGMPAGHLDRQRVENIRGLAVNLVSGQRGYHRINVQRMLRAEHRLKRAGDWLFAMTIAACGGWLIIKLTGYGHMQMLGVDATALVTFVTALLPAIGAALYGVRMQSDFAGAAERSTAIGRQLARLQIAMERDPVDELRLSSRLRRLSEILQSELERWRQVSEVRPLELPG